MADLTTPVYGKCPCGGRFQNRWMEIRMAKHDGAAILIQDVPVGVCPDCRSQVYRAETIARIEAVYRASREVPETPLQA